MHPRPLRCGLATCRLNGRESGPACLVPCNLPKVHEACPVPRAANLPRLAEGRAVQARNLRHIFPVRTPYQDIAGQTQMLHRRTSKSGASDAAGGHAAVVHDSWGTMPRRSSMIMVMKALGLWKPRALARMRPMLELLDSAITLVSRHSMVASRGPVGADGASELHERGELGARRVGEPVVERSGDIFGHRSVRVGVLT